MYDSLEKITSIGVIPSIGLLLPENGTQLSGLKLPDFNYQLKIHSFNTKCLFKYKLNPLLAKAGCPRNGSYSPTNEFYLDNLLKERV